MTATIILLSLLLIVECLLLFHGQRRLFWMASDATGIPLVSYIVAVPGTVLHEAAHYLMCVILRVPVGAELRDEKGKKARVRLFYPQKQEDGGVVLGSVPHAATDPLRGALIAVAPLLLVPPLFIGISYLLLGNGIFVDPVQALKDAQIWQLILWGYVAFSAGQASFPSAGDHIGILGGICLILVGIFTIYIVYRHGSLYEALKGLTLVLAVPAGASALGFAGFYGLIRLRLYRQAKNQT